VRDFALKRAPALFYVYNKGMCKPTCPTCGIGFEQRSGRGRPKIYDDDDCNQFEALFTMLEQRALIVSRKAEPEARNMLRSRAWKFANIFNNTKQT
jgi:hypothetical protein